jgi:CRP/FNR family transcriptional regulator
MPATLSPEAAFSSCDACPVRERAICAALGMSDLQALSTMGRRRSLSAGESLIWEGDDPALVGTVIEGTLILSTGTSDGREQIVGVVHASDFVGRPFGGATRHTVTALTPARVCVFSRRDFSGFAERHPQLERKLLEHTLAELDRARGWILLLGRKSAEERIATFLLDMSRHAAMDGAAQDPVGRFELPFSRQQVADLLGLTIETVSRQFTKLKRADLIDLPSRRAVVIKDRAALTLLAG